MTDTGAAEDADEVTQDARHPLTEGDFVQYTIGDDVYEGEIAERREQSAMVWEFTDGSPEQRRRVPLEKLELHPTGRL